MHRATDDDWDELVQRWKARQEELRRRMIVTPLPQLPRFVAGADAALSPDQSNVRAAAVVYDREEKRIIEVRTCAEVLEVPYVPGFLSFREGAAILAAIRMLKHPFGAVLFDGQGYAHPRRCGVACHLAIELDMPGVGVGKSRLIGTHGEPRDAVGAFVPLLDGDEEIGSVLRTRAGVKPVYVSIGHRVDLPTARALVLACGNGYRIPEPTRQADASLR